jgi:hypothetical protein
MLTIGLLLGAVILTLIVWDLVRSSLWGEPGKAAEHRAEQLLRQHVTPRQYQQLQEEGYIELASRLHPGRIYRLFRRRQRVQIFVVNEDDGGATRHKLAELCVVARDAVPDADLFLAHKWMLEGDERAYLAIANRIPYPVPR